MRKTKQIVLMFCLTLFFVVLSSERVFADDGFTASVSAGEGAPQSFSTFTDLQTYLNDHDFNNQSVVVTLPAGTYEQLALTNHSTADVTIVPQAESVVIKALQATVANTAIDASAIEIQKLLWTSDGTIYQNLSFAYQTHTLSVSGAPAESAPLTATVKLSSSAHVAIISSLQSDNTVLTLSTADITVSNSESDFLVTDAHAYRFKASGKISILGNDSNNTITIDMDDALTASSLEQLLIDGKGGEDSIIVTSSLSFSDADLYFYTEHFTMKSDNASLVLNGKSITIDSMSSISTQVDIANVTITSDALNITVSTESDDATELATETLAVLSLDHVVATINQDINLNVFSKISTDIQDPLAGVSLKSTARLLLSNGSSLTSASADVMMKSSSTILLNSMQKNSTGADNSVIIAQLISDASAIIAEDVTVQGNAISLMSENTVSVLMSTVYAANEADLYLVALELQQNNEAKVKESARIKGKTLEVLATTSTDIDLLAQAGSVGLKQTSLQLKDVFELLEGYVSDQSLSLLKEQIMSVIYNIGFLEYQDINASLEGFLEGYDLSDLSQAVGSMSLATLGVINQGVVDGILDLSGGLVIKALVEHAASVVADGTQVVKIEGNEGIADYGLGLANAIHTFNLTNTAEVAADIVNGLSVDVVADISQKNDQALIDARARAGYNSGDIGHTSSLVINSVSLANRALYSAKTTPALSSLIVVASSEKQISSDADSSYDSVSLNGGASVVNTIADLNIAQVTSQAVFADGVGNLSIQSLLKQSVLLNGTAGSGADAGAIPVYGASIIVSESLAELTQHVNQLQVEQLDITASSDKSRNMVLRNVMDSNYHARGMNVVLSVVNDKVQALLNRAVKAGGSVKVRSRSTHTHISSATNESSDTEEGDPDWLGDFINIIPDAVLNNFKSLSSSMMLGLGGSAFTLFDSFGYSFSSTEEDEVQTAGNIIANIIISDVTALIGADVEADAVEVVTESGFSIYNLADSVTVGSNDKATSGSLILLVAVINGDAQVTHSVTARALTIRSTTAETDKYLTDHEESSSENHFYSVAISGGEGSKKSTAGAVVVTVITQRYQALMSGNAMLSAGNGHNGDLVIASNVEQLIYSEALATHGIPFSFDFLVEAFYNVIEQAGSEDGGDEESTKGLGASISVLVLLSDIEAAYTGSSLTANNVSIIASYISDIETAAEAGAALNIISDDTAFDGGVAVNVLLPDVLARLGADSPVQLSVLGNLSVTADVESRVYANSFASSISGKNSKGISVAFNFINGDIFASLNANGTLGGSLTVKSTAANQDLVNADAAALINPIADIIDAYGLDEGIAGLDLEQGNFNNNNYDAANDKPNALIALILDQLSDQLGDYEFAGKSFSMTLLDLLEITSVVPTELDDIQDEDADPEDKTEERRVGLAATVAINVLLHDVSSKAKGGLVVAGAVDIKAVQDNNSRILAGALSFSTGNSIALSVGVFVNNVNTAASLGSITGQSIHLTSDYTQNLDPSYADKLLIQALSLALSLSFSSNTNNSSGNSGSQNASTSYAIAGAIALIVSNATTSASIDANQTIRADALVVQAIEKVKLSARAWDGSFQVDVSEEGESKAGGVSVAMIYSNNIVEALIGNNAKLVVDTLSLQAIRLLVTEGDRGDGLDITVGASGETYEHTVYDFVDEYLNLLTYNNYYVEAMGASLAPVGSFSGNGSITLLVLNEKAKALIGDGVIIQSVGDIVVVAQSDSSAVSILGAVALAQNKAIGGTIGFVYNKNTTEAGIGANTTLSIRNGGLSLTASDTRDLLVFAVAAAFSYASDQGDSGLGFEGVVIVFVSDNNINASVGQTASILADGDVSILANNQTQLKVFGNGLTIAQGISVGITVIVAVIRNNTQAIIAEGVTISAQSLSVKATATEDLLIEGANAGASTKSTALTVGAIVVIMHSKIIAAIEASSNGSLIDVASLEVIADSLSDSMIIAGSISASGSTAVGVVVNVNVYRKVVKAYVNQANIKADVAKVTVNGEELLLSLVLGVSAAKETAVDAVVSVVNMINELQASLTGTLAASGNVSVTSDYSQSLKTYVGALAASGTASIGASVVQLYTNNSNHAYVQGTVSAKDVLISANTAFALTNIVFGAAASGKFSGAGAVSVVILSDSTLAFVGADSVIVALGNITISADSKATILTVVGQISASGSAAIGASTDTLYFERTTEAYVGDRTIINGNQGLYGSLTLTATSKITIDDVIAGIAGGQVSVVGMSLVIIITENTTAYLGDSVWVKTSALQLMALLHTEISAYLGRISGGNVAGGASSYVMNYQAYVLVEIGKQSKVLVDNAFNMSATTHHDFLTGMVSAQGGNISISGASAVLVQNDTVAAIIGDNAIITARSISVQALAELLITAYIGMIDIGNYSVGLGSLIINSSRNTLISLGVSAQLSVFDDLRLNAESTINVKGYVIGAGLSFTAAVAGQSYVLISDDTVAVLSDAASQLISEYGSVSLIARSATDSSLFLGVVSASLSIGAALAGANATFNFTNHTAVQAGHITAKKDIVISATTETKLDVTAASGSIGLISVTIAGTVVTIILNSTLEATVLEGAAVQGDSVSVLAHDAITIDSRTDGLSGSLLAASGASVNILIIRQTIQAKIAAGATVSAVQAIRVHALSQRLIDVATMGLSLGGGAAFAGSVVVINSGSSSALFKHDDAVGTQQDFDTADYLNDVDASNSNTMVSFAPNAVASNEYADDSSTGVNDINSRLISLLDEESISLRSQISSTAADTIQASVGSGAKLSADNIEIWADDATTIVVDSGNYSGAMTAAIGVSLVHLTLNTNVLALVSKQAEIKADSRIALIADASAHNLEITSIVGSASGYYGASGSIILIEYNVNTAALVENQAVLTQLSTNSPRALAIDVLSDVNLSATIIAGTASLAGLQAGSTVLSFAFNGSLSARILAADVSEFKTLTVSTSWNQNTKINAYTGSVAGISVGGLSVNHENNLQQKTSLGGSVSGDTVHVYAYATDVVEAAIISGTVGIAGISAGVINFSDSSSILTWIDGAAEIVADVVDIISDYKNNYDLDIKGASFGAVMVGATIVNVVLDSSITTYVGDESVIIATDRFRLLSLYNSGIDGYGNHTVPLIDGAPYAVHVRASSSTSSLVSGVGVAVFVNQKTGIVTRVGQGTISAGNQIQIAGFANFRATLSIGQNNASLAGLGYGSGYYEFNAQILTEVMDDAELTATDVAIQSSSTSYLASELTQASGGISVFDGNANALIIRSVAVIQTVIHDSVVIDADRNLIIEALSHESASVSMNKSGNVFTGITVTGMIIDLNVQLTVLTQIGNNNSMTADYIRMSAVSTSAYAIDNDSALSSGSLAGVIGASTTASFTASNRLILGNDNVLSAGDALVFESMRESTVTHEISGSNGISLVSAGSISSAITHRETVHLVVGNNNNFTSLGQQSLTVLGLIETGSSMSGSSVALAVGSSTLASTLTSKPDLKIVFGDDNQLSSVGEDVLIAVLGSAYLKNTVDADQFAILNVTSKSEAINIIQLDMNIDFGNRITIRARDILINITLQKFHVISKANAYSASANQWVYAYANIIDSYSMMNIRSNNGIFAAQDALSITTAAVVYLVETEAYGVIDGVTGSIHSESEVAVNHSSKAQLLGQNSQYQGIDIAIIIDTPIDTIQTRDQQVYAESDTIVEFVLETVRKLVYVLREVTDIIVKWLPWPLNKLVEYVTRKFWDWVYMDVLEWVAKTVNAVVKTEAITDINSITLLEIEGEISYGASNDIFVNIDADGNISASDGTIAVLRDGAIHIDEFNIPFGSLTLSSLVGTVIGNVVIRKNNNITGISITNQSSYDLIIAGLDLIDHLMEYPDYLVTGTNVVKGELEGLNITYQTSGGITKYIVTSVHDDADVTFSGSIQLDALHLIIDVAGNVAVEPGVGITVYQLEIRNANQFGTDISPITVIFVLRDESEYSGDGSASDVHPRLSVLSAGSVMINAYLYFYAQHEITPEAMSDKSLIIEAIHADQFSLVIQKALVYYLLYNEDTGDNSLTIPGLIDSKSKLEYRFESGYELILSDAITVRDAFALDARTASVILFGPDATIEAVEVTIHFGGSMITESSHSSDITAETVTLKAHDLSAVNVLGSPLRNMNVAADNLWIENLDVVYLQTLNDAVSADFIAVSKATLSTRGLIGYFSDTEVLRMISSAHDIVLSGTVDTIYIEAEADITLDLNSDITIDQIIGTFLTSNISIIAHSITGLDRVYNIQANHLEMLSTTAIGDLLKVKLNGELSVEASGNVGVVEVSGSLNIREIKTAGDVILKAARDVVALGDGVHITADDLLLDIGKGFVNVLRTDLHGNLSVEASEDVLVTETDGDLVVVSINTQGKVVLSVLDGNMAVTAINTSGNVSLDAALGDMDIAELNTQGNVTASVGAGDMNVTAINTEGKVSLIVATGAMDIIDINTLGDVNLSVGSGNLFVSSVDTQGNVTVSVGAGNLVAVGTGLHIVARHLVMDVGGGVGELLNVALTGNLQVTAVQDVSIQETLGTIRLSFIHTSGNVRLSARGGLVALDGAVHIIGQDLDIAVNEGIGVVLTTALSGVLTVVAKEDVSIEEVQNDLRVGALTTKGNVSLKAMGSVLASGNGVHIEADTLMLVAGGSIASLTDLLHVILQGTISLSAGNDIGVWELEGDLDFTVIRTTGDALIQAYGAIQAFDYSALITVHHLQLLAQAIGHVSQYVSVDLSGALSAQATGNIYIKSLSDLTVQQAISNQNINLEVAGDIRSSETAVSITARDLHVLAQGDIGSSDWYLSMRITGSVHADADEKVYIHQVEGDLTVDQLNASHTIGLRVNGGLLVLDQSVNINVDTLILEVGKSIGTADAVLKLSVNHLHAIASFGSIHLSNNQSLNIKDALHATGLIDLLVAGNLSGSLDNSLKAQTLDINVFGDVGTALQRINLDVSDLSLRAENSVYLNQSTGHDLVVHTLISNQLADIRAGVISGRIDALALKLDVSSADITTMIETIDAQVVNSLIQRNMQALQIIHISATSIQLDVAGDVSGFEDRLTHISSAQSVVINADGSIGQSQQRLILDLSNSNRINLGAVGSLYLQTLMNVAGLDQIIAGSTVDILAAGALANHGEGLLSARRIDVNAQGYVGQNLNRLNVAADVIAIRTLGEVGLSSGQNLNVESIMTDASVYINGPELLIQWVSAATLTAAASGNAVINGSLDSLSMSAGKNAQVTNDRNLSVGTVTVGGTVTLDNRGNVSGGIIDAQTFIFTIGGSLDVATRIASLGGQASGAVVVTNERSLQTAGSGIVAGQTLMLSAIGDMVINHAIVAGTAPSSHRGLQLLAGGMLTINSTIASAHSGLWQGASIRLNAGAAYASANNLEIVISRSGNLLLAGSITAASTYIAGGADHQIEVSESMGPVTIESQAAGSYRILVGSLRDSLSFMGTDSQEIIELDLSTMNNTGPVSLGLNGLGGGDELMIIMGLNSNDSLFDISHFSQLSIAGTDRNETLNISAIGLRLTVNDSKSAFSVASVAQFSYQAHAGNKRIIIADTFAPTDITTGDGNDYLQIGILDQTSGAIATTAGYLTRGVSHITVVDSKAGDDVFVVYSNKASLSLDGGSGDDVFYIRAFIEKASGIRLYNVNEPLHIDGGMGTDTIHLIKAYIFDRFAIGDATITGSGVDVSYVNVEIIEQESHDYSDSNLESVTHDVSILDAIAFGSIQIASNYYWSVLLLVVALMIIILVAVKAAKKRKMNRNTNAENN